MFRKRFSGIMALVVSLIVITNLGFCTPVSGGDKCLVLHSVMVEGNTIDSPRIGGRNKGEYMMSQDFCLSEKYGSAQVTGRRAIGSHSKRGWYRASTMGLIPDLSGGSAKGSCEAIWYIEIYGDTPDSPNEFRISGVIYVLEFKEDRSIIGGREHPFELSTELDKEFLMPIGPMGEIENVSLAAKLTKGDSE